MITALLVTISGWSIAFLVRTIIDGSSTNNFGTKFQLITAGVVLALLFRLGYGLVRERIQQTLTQRIQARLGTEYIRHVFYLPVAFFDNKHFTEAYARFRELQPVRAALSEVVFSTGLDVLMLFASLTIMLISSVKLTLIIVVFLPLNFIVVLILRRSVKNEYRKMMEAGCEVAERFHDGLLDPQVAKAFVIEDIVTKRVEEMYEQETKHELSAGLRQGATQQLNSFITAIAQTAFLWVGAQQISNGTLTAGQLMFFFSLSGFLLLPVERLANLNTTLQEALVALERFEDTLKVDREDYRTSGKKMDVVRGEIEFRNVSFGYRDDQSVLNNVSFIIPAKSAVAIIGESGSGKTTLINLLAGFYAPRTGSILIDGEDLSSLNLRSYRKNLGIVFQKISLLADSIVTNITLRRENITYEDAVSAATIAQADEFIRQLPQGYDTPLINRGVGLSGGQAQRLAIARAIVGHPGILILDEATSNLDSRTEEAVHNAIEMTKTSRTSIIIAHRLSTIRNADLIVVLEEGRIVEQGKHEDLYAARKTYYELFSRQAATADAGTTYADTHLLSSSQSIGEAALATRE
jgi:ABC-type bacteriocin/lantibiotic exporter with double-glycine peptidase domain